MNNASDINTPLTKPSGIPISQNSIGQEERAKQKKESTLFRIWRALATYFCWLMFGLCTPIINVIAMLIYILPVSKSHRRQSIRLLISHSCSFYLFTMKFLKLLTYTYKPAANIDTKGKLIIANHPGLLDAFYILAMCPNLCCIAKDVLWKNPFTALLVRMADYINNSREDLIEQSRLRLNRGENILIFPEGTRNSYDDQLDFKRGAANIAILTGCDIVPVLINCYPRILQKGEKWYSTPRARPHLAITVLDIINIEDFTADASPKTLQYRKLTNYFKQLYKSLLPKSNHPN